MTNINKISMANLGLDESEIKAVAEVIRSGSLRQGKITQEFENAFAAKFGVKHAVAVSSGTAALHVACLALLKPGDEVLVPAFTFIATASMVAMAGAKPIFCDIDSKTWTLDPEGLERKVTAKTKALIGVHLFGNACDIDSLRKFAGKRGIRLIWDCAQSLGTTYQEISLGAFEDAACFSFYPSKNMTVGEGGMITTSDDELAKKFRLLHEHGLVGKYEHPVLGLNYRMTDVAAAMGLVQLKKLDGFLEGRKKAAAVYQKHFKSHPLFEAQEVMPGCEHSYNYYSLRIRPDAFKISRDAFLDALQNEGIPTAVYYPKPLHQQPCFKEAGGQKLPVSESLCRHIFSLPMHPFLTGPELETILRVLEDQAAKYSGKSASSNRR